MSNLWQITTFLKISDLEMSKLLRTTKIDLRSATSSPAEKPTSRLAHWEYSCGEAPPSGDDANVSKQRGSHVCFAASLVEFS